MSIREAAKAILARRQSLARAVVARQYDCQPKLRHRYGEGCIAKCVQDTEYHLAYLASALMFSGPALFGDFIGWVKTTLTIAKIRLEDVERHLVCMWDVLREQLPQKMSIEVRPYVERRGATRR